MTNLFLIFSLVFGLAVGAGMAARLVRQPAFLGHVVVGIALGFWGVTAGGEMRQLFDILSSAGIMLLLFLVGLEMNIAEVKKMGKVALIVAAGQILVTMAFFGGVFSWFGLALSTSLFLALAVSFSSTIIVVKLLSEKHDLGSLPGKVAVALLLVQDLAAIVALIVFGGQVRDGVAPLLTKVIILVAFTALISRSVMPRILHRLAKSTDELILFSLAWCFVLAAAVASPLLGLSLPIGGFLAGLALSGSFEHAHIATKIKPLRDFFLTIFFVGLGLKLRFDGGVWLMAIWLSLAVIVVKPLIVWLLMRLVGYRQRVAFYSGLLLGQVSEFGFILVGVGQAAGFFDSRFVALVSLVGLVTMVISSYLIIDNEFVFRLVRPILNFVWKDRYAEKETEAEALADHIVLFGCQRMGRSMLLQLAKNKEKVLIVDFDPEVVRRLSEEGYPVVYADAADTDAYDQLNLAKAKMVVSTVEDIKDNLVMLAEIKRRRLKVSVVVDAQTPEDAKRLYAAGATYVIFPHFVGGLHLGDLVRKGVREKDDFESYRKYQQEVMSGVYA